MLDSLLVLCTIAFFGLALAYIKGCDLLKPKGQIK